MWPTEASSNQPPMFASPFQRAPLQALQQMEMKSRSKVFYTGSMVEIMSKKVVGIPQETNSHIHTHNIHQTLPY